ncbi:hypothetical protein A3752_22905 [Oleiphilus sp. HI0081]|nr:hypothetical protein A3729_14600 [Oleiphilus sp. HI0043]KZY50768.1 hypothetical protein A3732_04490 [Oleiphilus sp. HI0050]KZY58760.1 hypothetical protein A3735_17130 [Oleiphilus sp. HI0061]KZY76514.1 hypothetical protein A3740_12600 [Oleiphilus sp. HI0068]KZY78887.1 hypothetical protein A3741_20905 [Oleiphilus sp. HI0069]KZY89599.1 hypothetical protein A3743_00850 [Oleiphilus sp. HI0072]KZZ21737.1 hypothetical protein A3749_17320 [Oleiphilus sp. HI0078]KZZ27305.1 hypothetical protein A37
MKLLVVKEDCLTTYMILIIDVSIKSERCPLISELKMLDSEKHCKNSDRKEALMFICDKECALKNL